MALSGLETKIYNMMNNSIFDFGFYHPYVVDFAIVLPIIALFLHFISILTRADEASSKAYFKVSNLLFFIGSGFVTAAYLTGLAEGPDVRQALSMEGRGLYDAHQALATYIAAGFLFLSFIKIISLLVKKDPLRYIFGTLFSITMLILIYAYAIGISLVYDYGAGVVCSG
ncbi:MAG: hypothetical protein DSZ05_07450 [Sulfurospirillum sp.]|nr:MAG: hypothetical protein DSZ05_07450 [Sulfurospirillum sp.]